MSQQITVDVAFIQQNIDLAEATLAAMRKNSPTKIANETVGRLITAAETRIEMYVNLNKITLNPMRRQRNQTAIEVLTDFIKDMRRFVISEDNIMNLIEAERNGK